MECSYHRYVLGFWSRTPMLTATDQRVHLWYYDRQGGIQSYGLDIIKNLPHFFVLLLAFQRLDLREWGYASGLSFDKDNQYSARMDVTLHIPAVNSDVSSQQSTPSVNFTDNQALRRYWGLVGRATAVYVCNLTGRPIEEQVVKLSWPEVTRKPEPEILKELESILDDEVKGHVPVLLASQMPPTMNTGLIRQRLQAKQPQCTEARGPRQLVVTVTRKLRPVWDLTADELFDVWIQCILCMSIDSVSGVYDSCELQVTSFSGGRAITIAILVPPISCTTATATVSWVSSMTGILQLPFLLRPFPTRTVRELYHLWHYSLFPSRTQCTYFDMMQNLSSGCYSGCVAALMGQERKFLWLPTSCGGIWTCSLVRKREETSFRLLNWSTSTSLPTMDQTATFAYSWRSCYNNCARTSGWTPRQIRITTPKTRRISHY